MHRMKTKMIFSFTLTITRTCWQRSLRAVARGVARRTSAPLLSVSLLLVEILLSHETPIYARISKYRKKLNCATFI